MDNEDLASRVRNLVAQISPESGGPFGHGSMSCSVYDSAWVSLVTKDRTSPGSYLFPECFEYVLLEQDDDGSWPAYASPIDGILNTAAALLALKRHAQHSILSDLQNRIERATTALQHLLDSWKVEGTVHVGFEILVPALLDYLAAEDLTFDFPGREALYAIRSVKMNKFRPEYLYMPKKITALHSLEAFIGMIDFDKVGHHKVDGSFMASPSSTAAYLMNTSEWDDECEDYLRHVLKDGAGCGGGGIPSAFPSPIFETTWVLSTLADAGIDLQDVAPTPVNAALQYLEQCFENENGLLGFSPSVGADADDTAKAILTFNLLGKQTSADSLLNEFEDTKHFKTYQLERDPSFSANCNVLNALLHSPEVSKYTSQLEKALSFLCSAFQKANMAVKDKWNLSRLYPAMLMMQACARYSELVETGELLALESFSFFDNAVPILQRLIQSVLSSQNTDGSWGSTCCVEQTAYAVLTLAYGIRLPELSHSVQDSRSRIQRGQEYLRHTPSTKVEHLWIEKVSYGSKLLSESYVLAALSIDLTHSTTSGRRQSTTQRTDSQDSGYDSESSSAGSKEDDEKHDGRDISNRSHTSKAGESNSPTATRDDSRQWKTNEISTVLRPYEYLDGQPGKDIRTQLLMAFNQWLRVSDDQFAATARIVRRLHNASLLVDDIEDSSTLRRGKPAAHCIFGVPETLNSANYVYFQALQDVHGLQSPAALDLFVKEMLNLHIGQGLDLHWRDNFVCPTEDEYLRMISGKTGGLFRLAIGLMQAMSQYKGDCTELVNTLGMIFQLRDDYINLRSAKYAQTKGQCEDLEEGKFSFPILHSIQAQPDDQELFEIVKSRTHDDDVKQRAVSIIDRTGSFKYTRELVGRLTDRAYSLIDLMEEGKTGTGEGVRKILALMALDDE